MQFHFLNLLIYFFIILIKQKFAKGPKSSLFTAIRVYLKKNSLFLTVLPWTYVNFTIFFGQFTSTVVFVVLKLTLVGLPRSQDQLSFA
jgi:hypothetical protein